MRDFERHKTTEVQRNQVASRGASLLPPVSGFSFLDRRNVPQLKEYSTGLLNNQKGILQCVRKKERTNHLNETDSLKGHVMYARDQRVLTRRAGRKTKAKRVRTSGAKKVQTQIDRDRFFTHTEGHYVRTLSARNLGTRVNIRENKRQKVMEHVLQGRLDMCRNCQKHILQELKKKYPGYIHQVHYSFSSGDGSRTHWRGKGRRIQNKIKGGHTITRYDESEPR
jgi:hypothetical protein